MMRRLRAMLQLISARWALVIGGVLLSIVALMALSANFFYPDDPLNMAGQPLLWPGQDIEYPLGTDSLGRDISAGLFHGARTSLLVGFISTAVALLVGTAVGAVAGYYEGLIDDILMRITELFQTIPQFMLAIVLLAILGPSIEMIIAALTIVSWPVIARLARAEFIILRNREFVQSCKVIGMSDARIIMAQILPNAAPPIVVMSSILIATAILMEAGLSFLGFGDPNVLTWGTMIGMGKDQLREAWYIVVIPGLALLVTALALNLVGEGLNDALNPRLREQR